MNKKKAYKILKIILILNNIYHKMNQLKMINQKMQNRLRNNCKKMKGDNQNYLIN